MRTKITFCLLLFLIASLSPFAQVKIEPDRAGRAPHLYVAPLITPDDVITVYPQLAPYWTGSTNGSGATDGEINTVYPNVAWATFDVSGIPDGSTINAITFYGYVNNNNWPYWSITPMGSVNIFTDPAATIYYQILSNYQQGTAYSYNEEPGTLPIGWLSRQLEPQAFPDLQAALTQDWFSMGFVEFDFSASYYINFDGWNQPNIPYLEIDYTPSLQHDVGTYSINVPAAIGTNTFTPTATVFSASTEVETFNVTMTITPAGYTSIKTVTNLQPGEQSNVLFDNWFPAEGTYTIEVCTELATDPNPANDCKTDSVSVINGLFTISFGYNAYDQTGTYPLGTLLFSPGGIEPTGGVVTDFMCAGTFNTDDQTWYAYQFPGINFYKVNFVTGDIELIGPGNNCNIRGLAYDPTTIQLYGLDANNLYLIDKLTGDCTLIGPSGLNLDYIALACSPGGQLYGFDMNNNALYSINKSIGSATLVGLFPFDVTYAQSAEFDLCNNILYWAAWDAGISEGRFYIVDPTNANLTFLGYIGNAPGLELDALGIYCYWTPVELTSFRTDVNKNNVTLNWATATETNNRGFEVQRSKSGSEYETVTFVNGKGTTTEIQYYSFIDAGLTEGVYTYRLKQVDYDGTFEYSDEILAEVVIPKVYSLSQNYPNPFNPTTRIDFSLESDSRVTLKVFNVLGEEVATLLNTELTTGVHYVNFDGTLLNSGFYFYTLTAGKFVSTKKMVLLK